MEKLVLMKKKLAYFFSLLLCLFFAGFAAQVQALPQNKLLAMHVALDAQGQLWRVVQSNGLIEVDVSADLGKTFSAPMLINPTAQKTDTSNATRPVLAIGPEGNIYVAWTEVLKTAQTAHIWLTRSIDGGKTFERPTMLYQDEAKVLGGLAALNVSQSAITVLWLKKRDGILDKGAERISQSAAIYYAVSTNQGLTFEAEQKLADSHCVDCRIALTNKMDGTVVMMWLDQIEGDKHDYKMTELPKIVGQLPIIKRATFGRWRLGGCAQNSAALAIGGQDKNWWGYHMAWFEGGKGDFGKDIALFYARVDGEAWVSSPAKKVGNFHKQQTNVALLSLDDAVWLIWTETEATGARIVGLHSADGGRSWSDSKVLAVSNGAAGFPQLLTHHQHVYLVWNTEKENLQVITLQ